jgi:hypothetical protein
MTCIEAEPERGAVYQKYGNMLMKKRKEGSNADKPIELLKKALVLIDGDQNRQEIALGLQEVYKELGIEPEGLTDYLPTSIIDTQSNDG